MLERLDAPEGVLAYKASGTMIKDDLVGVREAIAAALAESEHVGAYVDLTGYEDMTLGALAEDLRIEWSLLDHLDRFRHVAVVSDAAWVRRLVHFAASLVPKMEIRVFAAAETDAAMHFAAERPQNLWVPGPGIYQIVSRLPHTLAFEIEGRMERDDVDDIVPALQAAFAKYDHVNLLVHIKRWGGFSPSLLADPALWSMKLSAVSKIRRYAIVGAKEWLESAVDLTDPIFEMRIEHFEEDEIEEAWAWLARD